MCIVYSVVCIVCIILYSRKFLWFVKVMKSTKNNFLRYNFRDCSDFRDYYECVTIYSTHAWSSQQKHFMNNCCFVIACKFTEITKYFATAISSYTAIYGVRYISRNVVNIFGIFL